MNRIEQIEKTSKKIQEFWQKKIGTNTDQESMALIYSCLQTLNAVVASINFNLDIDLSILGYSMSEEMEKEWKKLCETMKG